MANDRMVSPMMTVGSHAWRMGWGGVTCHSDLGRMNDNPYVTMQARIKPPSMSPG